MLSVTSVVEFEGAEVTHFQCTRHYKLRLVYFYPYFHCGLESRAVNIADNLCPKQEFFSIKPAVYNQEWVIMARVR